MNRGLFILLLGLATGVAGHFGYFAWHRPQVGSDTNMQLAWMKTELRLDDAQFARIVELHEKSSPRLHELARQVEALRTEFAAFEATRVKTEEVDFLAFARFVETRRAVDRSCLESARSLVKDTASLLTPTQRGRYLGLIAASGGTPLLTN